MSDISVQTTCLTYVSLPTHNKFWTIQIVGRFYYVTYGRIGSKGATQVKEFSTIRECAIVANKQIRSKSSEGYSFAQANDHPKAPQTQIDYALENQGAPRQSVAALRESRSRTSATEEVHRALDM